MISYWIHETEDNTFVCNATRPSGGHCCLKVSTHWPFVHLIRATLNEDIYRACAE